MQNNHIIRLILIILAVSLFCTVFMAGCGDDGKESNFTWGNKATDEPDEKVTEKPDEKATEVPDEKATDAPSADELSKYFKSVQVAADDTGIYAVVLKMSDLIADKGSLELVYYGAVGTPQENSVVTTFVIDYFTNDDGTYELRTFYDGEVYQNRHNLTEFKYTLEFGASVRAKDVTISYTPDGGQTEVIFHGESGNYIANHN